MTERISNYRVVLGDNQKELVEKVCAMIFDGWEPQGGISVGIFETDKNERGSFEWWAQAMVYRDKNYDSRN